MDEAGERIFDFDITDAAFPISKTDENNIFRSSLLQKDDTIPSTPEKKIMYDETYIDDNAADLIDRLKSKLCLEILLIFLDLCLFCFAKKPTATADNITETYSITPM